jgi:ribosome-binding factor A
MAYRRADRVSVLVHQELSRLLRNEVKDPRVGSISITQVRLSPDLSVARVTVTPLGGAGDGEGAIEGLTRASGWLRGQVGRALKLRHAPRLEFELDDTLDEAIRMTTMLSQMERARAEREDSEE